MTIEGDRICTKCHEPLPLGDFSKKLAHPSGLNPWCKGCCQKYYLLHRIDTRSVRAYPKQRNVLSASTTEKVCHGCNQLLQIGEFGVNNAKPDGHAQRCRSCQGIKRRQVPRTESRRKAGRSWYHENRSVVLARAKQQTETLRREIVDKYGGACGCCGESRWELLTLDHIEGRGKKDTPLTRLAGNALYRWLRSKNFPRRGLRLLCYNCNCSKGHLGYCPHEREREEVA